MRPLKRIRWSLFDLWPAFLQDFRAVALICFLGVAVLKLHSAWDTASQWFVLAVPRTQLLESLKFTPFAEGGACAAEVYCFADL
jgi:hypothetical protein